MSELTKRINQFFKSATRSEIDNVKEEAFFNDHLEQVFKMFYLQNKDINFIAYQTGCSRSKIDGDLKLIRKKLNKII